MFHLVDRRLDLALLAGHSIQFHYLASPVSKTISSDRNNEPLHQPTLANDHVDRKTCTDSRAIVDCADTLDRGQSHTLGTYLFLVGAKS
jgi:hypothetical protein